MGQLIKIGIVIRTYNEAELLPLTLKSVMGQTEQSFEVVIVDSGSTDSTVDIARSLRKANVIEIPQKEFSYGKALNIGIEYFQGNINYIVCLSGHSIPKDEHWLSKLVEPFRSDPKIAGVYGKHILFPKHESNKLTRIVAEGYPDCFGDSPFVTNSSHFFSNANSAIKYESWVKNRFDESLENCEDQLWAKNAIKSGEYIAYQPLAAVYHSHPDTFREYFSRVYREAMAFRRIEPPLYHLMGKVETMKILLHYLYKYVHESVYHKSLGGRHWYRYVQGTLSTLAIYKGRKDAKT